jgi:hypothetical protein
MWKSKRNVTITYNPLASDATKLDDLVQSQKALSKSDEEALAKTPDVTLPKSGVSSIRGIDTPVLGKPGAYTWRGKGMLILITSHWELIGYGEEVSGNKWAVTYFLPALYGLAAPAGIDIYSQDPKGVSVETMDGIMAQLKKVEDVNGKFAKIVADLVPVKGDERMG